MAASLIRTSTPGIYKRGDRYVVCVRDKAGRQLKRSARSLTQARTLKATLSADVARGEHDPDAQVGFADYARQWLDAFTGRTPDGIRPRTMMNYRSIIEKQAIPFFGDVQLVDVRLGDIKRYAAKVAERGVSANTVRLHVGPVRVLFATAVEDGILRANPVAEFRNTYGRRSKHSKGARALSDDQLAALVAELPEEYQLVVRFLAETGLRIGETIELRWGDVNFATRTVSVERRFYKDNIDAPKSRNGIRRLPINEAMAAALTEQRRDQSGSDEDLVFQSPWGERIDVHNWRRRVYKQAAVRAGVPWATIHMLRHTCASRLFRVGWTAKHVQHMLGHHSPAFTLSTYIHLMPDELNSLPLPSAPG